MASLRGRQTPRATGWLLAALATAAAATPSCDTPAPSPPLPCGTGAYIGWFDDEYDAVPVVIVITEADRVEIGAYDALSMAGELRQAGIAVFTWAFGEELDVNREAARRDGGRRRCSSLFDSRT